MNNTENKDSFDSLDALLTVAAGESGKSEISEYRNLPEYSGFSDDFRERMKSLEKTPENASLKRTEKRTVHLSLKRRFLIAAAAALLVCALAVGGIAGRNRDSALPLVSEKNGILMLSYDMKGIKPEKAELPPLSVIPEGYSQEISKAGKDALLVRYISEEAEITLHAAALDRNYSVLLGEAVNGYFEILVSEIFSGVASEGAEGSTVAWNDGEFAYIMRTELPVEEAIAFAGSICAE